MNNKHKKTLQALFASPPPREMLWADIEALLIAAGAILTEGRGSRVKFEREGTTIAFHRPHTPKTARAYHIPLLRDFFQKIGVKP